MTRAALVAAALALACQADSGAGAERGETAPARGSATTLDPELARRVLALSPLGPPPPDPTNAVADDPDAARLGQRLFFDPRFSKNGDTSCATCHVPGKGFADGLPLAQGVGGLERHSMALWNVAYQRWFFWDGRADSLWAQALVPLESPLEHGGSRLQYAHLVHDDPLLREEYELVFGPLPDLDDGVRFPAEGRPVPEREADGHSPTPPGAERSHHALSEKHFYHPHQRAWDSMGEEDRVAVTRVFVNLGKALAAYERLLVSRASPFDTYVEGLREGDPAKLAAISPEARRGLELFVGEASCHVCHNGPDLSDREFHDLGLPPGPGAPADDAGRAGALATLRSSPFVGTGDYSDDREATVARKVEFLPSHAHAGGGEFKTPTLRNVALSPPYMHQGQLATLEDVVRFYSTEAGQLDERPSTERILQPLHLSDADVHALVAFLESLTDERIDPALTRAPGR